MKSRHVTRPWLAAMGAVVLLVGVTACGSDDDGASETTQSTTADSTEPTDAPPDSTPTSDTPSTDAPTTDAPGTTGAAPNDPADPDAELTLVHWQVTPSFDTAAPSAATNSGGVYLVYDQLLYVEYGEDDRALPDPQPGLATEWAFADDGSYLEFTLRDDVTFHDGTPFNAEAVKINIERMLSAEGTPWLVHLASLAGVEVVDDYTVRLNLVAGQGASLPWLFAGPAGRMVSPKALAEGRDIGLDPGDSGSGPYIVTEFSPGQNIVFERAENYWDTRWPLVKKLTWVNVPDGVTRVNTLVTGEGQVTMVTPDAYAAAEEALASGDITSDNGNPFGDRGTNLLPGSMYHMYLHSKGDMADVRVRKAASLALDRQPICDTVYNGLCQPNKTVSWLFEDSIFFNDDANPLEYNPDEAKRLLADAGIPNPKFEMISMPGTPPDPYAAVVKDQLEAVGFDVTITNMAVGDALSAFRNGNGDALNWASGGALDPSVFFDQFYLSGWSLGSPETIDQLADLNSQGLDPTLTQEERAAIYQEAFKIAQDSYVTLDLWPVQVLWATTGEVRGNPQDLRTLYMVAD